MSMNGNLYFCVKVYGVLWVSHSIFLWNKLAVRAENRVYKSQETEQKQFLVAKPKYGAESC